MSSIRTLTMGTVLKLLFGTMVIIAIATLAIPIHNDINQLRESQRVVRVAEAGQAVFIALQNNRIQRGPTRVRLQAEAPTSDNYFATLNTARAKVNPAVADILRLCAEIDCTNGQKEIFSGFPGSLERLAAMQKRSDAALKVPLAERPAGIAQEFHAVATDVIDRLEKMSVALATEVRMSDVQIAELMAVKQAAWLARDGVGLGRTALAEARTKQALTPVLDRKIADLRGRALVNWSVVKELISRRGVPAELKAAVETADTEVFQNYYESVWKTAFEELSNGVPTTISNDTMNATSIKALNTLTAVADTAMRLTQEHAEHKYAEAQYTLMVQSGVLAFVLLLGAAGFVIVQRRITRPLGQMTDAMRRLAEGDLMIEVPGTDRKDEIGAMAGAVEIFKESAIQRVHLEEEGQRLRAQAEADKRKAMSQLAKDFDSKVSSLVESLVSASSQLESTANEMSNTAKSTSDQSSVLSESAKETGSNVQAVAAATEELASSASEIGMQIGQTAKTARKAVEDVRMTDSTVQTLSAAAEKIETVVALINDIAARTNLLALNATIEAARAGEAGRGFAVVASEVKDLANQTIRATDEIVSQINELQQATSGAVNAIRAIGERIEQVDEIASSIAAAAEEQQAATSEIARSISQAAQGADLVGRSVDTVRDAAESTGTSSGEVLSSAKELAKSSHALQRDMRDFISGLEAA